MKRKKVTALLLAAVTAVSMLAAGCGGKETGGADTGTESGTAAQEAEAVTEEPTEATLVLYGEESPRMSEFAENELHEMVLDAINVDLTIQYLPWSEYAGGKTELMLSSGEKFVTQTSHLNKCLCTLKIQ